MAREFLRFAPELPTSDAEDLPSLLTNNLFAIQGILDSVQDGHLDVVFVEPTKPSQGDIRYADGTVWNPGSGEGIYFFNSSGAWVKL
jgi:hypothetical protein|tara:strand:+ start:1295 stop:1555 length:261 start_codon:yes stop_codon:yes gene_type:complete